jgi:uncharacterized Tic20 family protein
MTMSEPIKTRLDDDTQQEPTSPPPVPESNAALPSELSSEEKNMGMFCHLAALSGYVGVPVGWLLGPLVIWLIKKETMPFVDQEGKKAINFQISVMIYALVCLPLCLVFIGFILLMALGILDLIMVIVNAMKASKGEETRYPLSMTFIK